MLLLSATSFSFIRRTDDDPPHLTSPTLWSFSSPFPPPLRTRNHLNLPESVWNERKMSSSTITQVGSLESVCLERRFYRFLNVILEFGGSAAVLNARPTRRGISRRGPRASLRREELWLWNVNIRQQQVSVIPMNIIRESKKSFCCVRVSLIKNASCYFQQGTIKINEACLNRLEKKYIREIQYEFWFLCLIKKKEKKKKLNPYWNLWIRSLMVKKIIH